MASVAENRAVHVLRRLGGVALGQLSRLGYSARFFVAP